MQIFDVIRLIKNLQNPYIKRGVCVSGRREFEFFGKTTSLNKLKFHNGTKVPCVDLDIYTR